MLEYQKVLLLKEREKAVSLGESFDLMYVNQHIGNRQFAFLRKHGKELLLVVANFSDEEVEIDVNIPAHAFDFLQMTPGKHSAIDLLTGEKTDFDLQPDGSLHLTIAPWYGRVYKSVVLSPGAKRTHKRPASS